MLTQYQLTLNADRECVPNPEWAYRLYASLLNALPDRFARELHGNEVTPISQFLTCEENRCVWTVNLIGDACEEIAAPVLEGKKSYGVGNHYKANQAEMSVVSEEKRSIKSVEELLALAANDSALHKLTFQTATAFKSQGRYVNLPTNRLILNNLVKKWNGCISNCPIEVEDDGVEALAEKLDCTRFSLRNRSYNLKGNVLHGFTGEMTFENRASGFHREILNALLLFSAYAGVGIKTTLGMGGVMCESL